MTSIYSRDEFYDLVWTYPLNDLAARLNLPVWRIRKLCLWHVIPLPGQRHWVRLAEGLRSARTPLRPLADGSLDTVDIRRKTQPRSTYARHVITLSKDTIAGQNSTKRTLEECMSEIGHSQQLILDLAARMQATRAIANIAIALVCTRDSENDEEKERFLKEAFPFLLENAATAPAQATKPELDKWMRQREQDFLNADLKKIMAQIEQLRALSKSAVS